MLSICLYYMILLKLKFAVSCNIVWVLPMEAGWIIQATKVRTLPVPPNENFQSSPDPLEAGAGIKI